jgi:hypothetical protein
MPYTTYLSGYGVDGADAKRSILVPCSQYTDYPFSPQMMSNMEAFTVFPHYWLGLVWPVPDLGADPKSLQIYIPGKNNTTTTRMVLPGSGLQIIPYYMSWLGQLALNTSIWNKENTG